MSDLPKSKLSWLLEDVQGVAFRDTKLTQKQALDLGSKSVRLDAFPEAQTYFHDLLMLSFTDAQFEWFATASSIKNWPKPLVRVRSLESSPGLWLIDDNLSGIVFLVWSDGYKVHPWKGTSYEVICTPAQKPFIQEATIRLFSFIAKITANQSD